ncbi:MAG: class I SAM-dependent methyltransferase [Devosia sp.]
MPAVAFDEYLASVHTVKGWLSDSTAILSHALMEHQTSLGITGNACEIGVHHGRYFIALALGLSGNERGVAIDLFEAQAENVDRSGKGNRAIFEQNIARFLDPQTITAIQGNSLKLSAADILALGCIRFFSVDGSHTSAATLNDIRLAEASLADGGIVAVDDVLSVLWTGVISGVSDYLHDRPGLRPFAIVPNKLLLCHPKNSAGYRDFLRASFPGAIQRGDAEFMGSIVDVYADVITRTEPALQAAQRPAPEARSSGKPRKPESAKIARLEGELTALKASRRYKFGALVARLARLGRHS